MTRKQIMKYSCLIILVASVACSPRVKRQTDGAFWWETLDASDTTVSPTGDLGSVSDTISETDAGAPTENTEPVESPVVEERGTNIATEGSSVDAANGKEPSYEPCSGFNRVCVPWNLCRNGTIITDGRGILTTRNGVNVPQHSECPLVLEVCCQEPEDYDYVYEDEIGTIISGGTDGKAPPPLSTCGQRNYNGHGVRITSLPESQSQFAEFPWMTAILRVEKFTGTEFKLYLCGGSLISTNVVLTAAHCVDKFAPEDILIRAGEWDTQQTNEEFPHQERRVKHSIVHPRYNPKSLFNDFALLVLETPVVAAPNVQTICLPHTTDNFDHKSCISTGWGKEEFGEKGTYQNILKKVSLAAVPNPKCETSLKTTRLGNYFKLHNSFMCAGGVAGQDTCRGDGGSPLVCKMAKGDNHIDGYYQAGIVAWGIGCGEEGIPGVYANVARASDWIREEMAPYAL